MKFSLSKYLKLRISDEIFNKKYANKPEIDIKMWFKSLLKTILVYKEFDLSKLC